MHSSLSIVNLEALKSAELHEEPFPYMVVDQLLFPNAIPDAMESFPVIGRRGSFALTDVSCQGSFSRLMGELQSEALRALIGERFGMDLQGSPAVITLRGYTTERDGHIHTDSVSKRITLLLYLNPAWEAPGGKLRLLYNGRDLGRYAAEIPPEAGRCVLFKVTPDCWHGHEPFVGVRRSIQLNYVHSLEAKERHLKRHRLSAWCKRLFAREARSSH